MGDDVEAGTGPDIGGALREAVDAGDVVGVVGGAWRDGSLCVAYAGQRNSEHGLMAERDTIFRIASLSKPVTSVAAMTMLEEGRFALDDPIEAWAPEFSAPRVLRSMDGTLNDTTPATRSITFRDLLTHRSGLTYSSFHDGPIGAAYDDALGGDIDSDVEPDEWIARLGALPLIDQPGAGFHYGRSTDLLGFLLARMDGTDLSEVLRNRVFDPLGMPDTGFTVPSEKRDRCALLYGPDDEGRIVHRLIAAGGATMSERPEDMTFVSGGQGLWSTVDDYVRFGRVFAENGAVDGVRILREDTLALMTTNQLTDSQRASSSMFGFPVFGSGHGFGLGVAVVLQPEEAPVTLGRGGVGTVGWPGAMGSWWQADPTARSVLVLLLHHVVEVDHLVRGFALGTYALHARFHELATAAC